LRRRYAEDILTALALPTGAFIQFRYGTDYVAPALQQRIADHSVLGEQSVLGFVSGIDSGDRFFLPARLASIVSAECVADIFIFKLRVGGYPNVEDWPLRKAELFAYSAQSIEKLIEANGRFYPATNKFSDPRVSDDGNSAQLWLGVARRLVAHETFGNSYFLRVDPPVLGRARKPNFDSAGRLLLTERQSARLPVSFYSEQYSSDKRTTLSCSTDGRFLRVSSDDTYDVALRYDTVEFWLQPNAPNFDALARVTLALETADPAAVKDTSLTTRIQLPVLVRRSRSTLVFRMATSAIGAFLIALPAILGPHFPVRLRVLSAVVGAVLIAFANLVIPRSGDWS
jgi:hypothetical protein